MPELPEVESLRRKLEKALRGRRIATAEVFEDPLVFGGIHAEVIKEAIEGAIVEDVGRKGKYWWLAFQDRPALMGHLGMSGWVRLLSGETPRFAKLILHSESGKAFAFTDPRRFGRLWMADDPAHDPRILALGPDSWLELPHAEPLHEQLTRRKAPIKGVLLDQKLFAGIGN